MLTTAPPRLYGNMASVPKSSVARKILSPLTINASLAPRLTRTIIVTMFARPILIPGTAMLIFINVSIYEKRRATATRTPSKAMWAEVKFAVLEKPPVPFFPLFFFPFSSFAIYETPSI